MNEKEEIENQKKYIEKIANQNKGKNLTYAIMTMGCQLNENDSEKISGMLDKMGYKQIEKLENADLIIFNTCCVREIWQNRRTKKYKRKQKYNNRNRWMYDARKTYTRKNKKIISIYRHSIWYTYIT